jgi:hypothetical protein
MARHTRRYRRQRQLEREGSAMQRRYELARNPSRAAIDVPSVGRVDRS